MEEKAERAKVPRMDKEVMRYGWLELNLSQSEGVLYGDVGNGRIDDSCEVRTEE